jgi:DsbC/DsbD-like thiol-disulfide interchange protein
MLQTSMRARFLILTLLVTLCAVRARAQDANAPAQLSARLVVPPAEIYPGQRITAGLYFKLEPGWHVYWSNPGDAGQPPRMQWALPPGVTAGALEFPVPKRLPVGQLMDFGYDEEVLFPVTLEVAPSFRPATDSVTLGGRASWLVCREICVPGSAELSVTRTAAVSAPSAPPAPVGEDAELVARFVKALPQPPPATLQAHFASAPGALVLTIATPARVHGAEFFPLDESLIANAAPQRVEPLDGGLRLTLATDENLRTPPEVLRGVLVLGGAGAYLVAATPAAAAAPRSSRAARHAAAVVLLALLFGGFLWLRLPARQRHAPPPQPDV